MYRIYQTYVRNIGNILAIIIKNSKFKKTGMKTRVAPGAKCNKTGIVISA